MVFKVVDGGSMLVISSGASAILSVAAVGAPTASRASDPYSLSKVAGGNGLIARGSASVGRLVPGIATIDIFLEI